MLVQLTLDNISFYAPYISGGAEGLGEDPWQPPLTVPPSVGTGHNTRDLVVGLINRGMDIFLETKRGKLYAREGDAFSLSADETGAGLKLTPMTMLLIGAGVLLLFRQPPGRR